MAFRESGAVISQTVEYALRAVLTIAQNGGEPCTSRKIAEVTQVPGAYLSKLMQGLVRGGIVTSQRGLHGGFLLTKSPDELTVFDIVDQVEPIRRIRECPLKIRSHGTTLCPLHRRLDRAMETIEDMFRATTVAELLSEPGARTPLCDDAKPVFQLGSGNSATEKRRGRSGRT